MFRSRVRRVNRHKPLIRTSSKCTTTINKLRRPRTILRTSTAIHKYSGRAELHSPHPTYHKGRSVNKHRRSRHVSIRLIRNTTRIIRFLLQTRHLVRRTRHRRRTVLTNRHLGHKGHKGQTVRVLTTNSRTSNTKPIQNRHTNKITKAMSGLISNPLRLLANNIKGIQQVISSTQSHLITRADRFHRFRRQEALVTHVTFTYRTPSPFTRGY